MAVITDPDNLSRNQVIFGTSGRKISIYPIGADTGTGALTDGATTGTNTFTSATDLAAGGVAVGDILAIKHGADAGHYRVSNATTVTLTLTNIDGTGVTWVDNAATALNFQVFVNGAYASEGFLGDGDTDTGGVTPPSGGDLADGVTLQAMYSFSKEEWRADAVSGTWSDDLIRHEFPFESITSESFEIGGGASHDIWNWFGVASATFPYTRKKVRTAGWAEKNLAGTTLNDYAGIITLGTLDSDARVYYQQVSTTTTPVNFTFAGVVNEAIRTYSDASVDNFNYRTYLKLFVRKKARSYAQSQISDIGVSTIQTIVNRFPLSHALDTAIVAADAEILGSSPWRDVYDLGVGLTNGVTTVSTATFSSAGSTFWTNEVVEGDVLILDDGADAGTYTIASVDSETSITVLADADFTTFLGSTGTTFSIWSYIRMADKTAGDGTVTDLTSAGAGNGLEDVDTDTGTLTDTTGAAFVSSSVIAGDWLLITGSTAGNNNGIYRILSVDSATQITVDTSDQPFPVGPDAAVTFQIFTAGMYLQYKNDLIEAHTIAGSETNVAFDDDDVSYGNRPTITLTTDTWAASVGPGTTIVVTGSANSGENDGTYTVHAQETTKIISLVITDTLVLNATDTSGALSVSAYEKFLRTIPPNATAAGNTYGYSWRLSGNNGTLAQVFQFVQHQLRQTYDIDYGDGVSRGDITDLLMAFSAPTGTTLDMFIDNLNVNDINNATFQDGSGTNRNYPYTASGSLVFNSNLTGDTNAKYWLFFTTDAAPGAALGYDYGTADAIIVQDADATPITGNVNGTGNHTGIAGSVDAAGNTTIPFSFAYDTNVQRGGTPGVAPVTLVALGLQTAQFVISTGSITRSTGITLSAVAALERNYSNL